MSAFLAGGDDRKGRRVFFHSWSQGVLTCFAISGQNAICACAQLSAGTGYYLISYSASGEIILLMSQVNSLNLGLGLDVLSHACGMGLASFAYTARKSLYCQQSSSSRPAMHLLCLWGWHVLLSISQII